MLKALIGSTLVATLTALPVLAETTIRFTLGWRTQGSDAPFLLAAERGYFAEEGLNVVIDQGEGSAATVTRMRRTRRPRWTR
jgi:NitT/TauT family transport system substrate-binding protein